MKTLNLSKIDGSFRDPSGHVFKDESGRILRTVTPYAKEKFDKVNETGLIAELERLDKITASYKEDVPQDADPSIAYLLSHPALPFISYPYEWTFEQLRAAALHHLNVHIRALEKNVTLSDATAYNIQFNGHKPVFIDRLSFIPYKEGDFWQGQKQFTEQFLAPLMFWSYTNVPYNDFYRGTLNGFPTEYLQKLLPWYKKLSFTYLNYIFLPSYFEHKDIQKTQEVKQKIKAGKVSKDAFVFLLKGLERFISKLPAPQIKTFWTNYIDFRNYDGADTRKKRDFVSRHIAELKPKTVWDMGCNTGEYSAEALKAGAEFVLGLEADHGALSLAWKRASEEKLNFLPIYMNICNPSASSGWGQSERGGLVERKNADFLLSLAVIHHIIIGNNVPVSQALDFLLDLAPNGIIEFVPKTDSMVQKMLAVREDIFPDYNLDFFRTKIAEKATIKEEIITSESGRVLFYYGK